MRIIVSLSVVPLLALASSARAQSLSLHAEGGAVGAAARQFRRTVVTPMDRGFAWVRYTGRHEPGPSIGARVRWGGARWGIEAATNLTSSDREVSAEPGGAGIPAVPPGAATIMHFGMRVLWRTPLRPLELGAGPLLITFGGAAYNAATPISLDRRSFVGASVLGRVVALTRGPLALNLTVEDAFYRVALVPVPPGADTTSTPLQHDVRMSLGIAWRLH